MKKIIYYLSQKALNSYINYIIKSNVKSNSTIYHSKVYSNKSKIKKVSQNFMKSKKVSQEVTKKLK